MMCELLVEGGERLYGELTIQGSKNSVLPILAATLLCADTCVIENCPKLRDVDASVAILRHLAAARTGRTVRSWSTQRAWTARSCPTH